MICVSDVFPASRMEKGPSHSRRRATRANTLAFSLRASAAVASREPRRARNTPLLASSQSALPHTHRACEPWAVSLSLHAREEESVFLSHRRRASAHGPRGAFPLSFYPNSMDAYTKGETLGSGTFGVVYKATHKEVQKNEREEREERRGERARRSASTSTPLFSPHSSHLFPSLPSQPPRPARSSPSRRSGWATPRRCEREKGGEREMETAGLWRPHPHHQILNPHHTLALALSGSILLSLPLRASPSPPCGRSRSCASWPTRTW